MKKITGIILMLTGTLFVLSLTVTFILSVFTDDVESGISVTTMVLTLIIGLLTILSGLVLFQRGKDETFADEILLMNQGSLEESIANFIKSNKEFKLRKLQNIGLIIYKKRLLKHLDDLHLDPDELLELDMVKKRFSLLPKKITKLKSRLAEPALLKLSTLKFEDHILEDTEKEELYRLASHLEISHEKVDGIIRNDAIKIFNQYRNSAIENRRLSVEEEEQLDRTREQLGLSDEDISKRDREELAYFKLLWEIENGFLPEMSAPIILQKNEICHLAITAHRLESKIVTTGRVSASKGVSIKIAKGVRYKVGATRSYPIKSEVTIRHPGTLCITSKRIVFKANKKGFSSPLKSLVSMDAYSNGVEFQKGSSNYLLGFERAELVPMIITAAVNNMGTVRNLVGNN